MINPEVFKRTIQSIDALGATPAVLVKVAKLVQDPNTSLDSICALLKNDGPLAADIIRISNSPYYAPVKFHGNLTAAITSIGLLEVNRVVNLSLARKIFARDLCSYGVTACDYWSSSVAAALVMERLAKHTGLNHDDAYTIGILHAIGRVLINRVIAEQGFSIYWDNAQPIEEWERDAVGFDFAEAGAMLLEHWRFPDDACNVIRWQLDVEKVVEQRSLLGALQFTQRLLVLTGRDFEKDGFQLPGTDPYVQASGLTCELMDQFISKWREDFKNIHQSVDFK